MIFKKRTFYGDEPERQATDHPAELERRVAHFLAVAPGLDAADLTVTAKGSTIILAGFVATAAEVARAEEAARHMQGVAEVINRIEIAGIE
ncbi:MULTISPECIES: BON domain-containing protein [Ensifer]|uniref:BON domain-containing protein n=1 Tax=Ensifer TaxID=106591 RepID=UPI0008075053|nr:BON domain-containing protein [Ensifer adhaerens]